MHCAPLGVFSELADSGGRGLLLPVCVLLDGSDCIVVIAYHRREVKPGNSLLVFCTAQRQAHVATWCCLLLLFAD